MKPGRIETYVHSDLTTQNKGVGVVRVLTETDFAARDEQFKLFAARAAMIAFVVGAMSPDDLLSGDAVEYGLAEQLASIRKYLGEDVVIDTVWSTTL
jgi:translation elongation factor EF-Ts